MTPLNKRLITVAISALLIGCSNPSSTDVNVKQAEAEDNISLIITEITWEDLMPEGEDELLETLYLEFYQDFEQKLLQGSTSLAAAARQQETDISSISEGSVDDTMEQIGTFNVVEELDGKRVRVPGYVVPFDFSANAPPNQIILVKAETAAKIVNIEDPVWLEGTLTTGEFLSDLGNSAYELNLSKLEPYEY